LSISNIASKGASKTIGWGCANQQFIACAEPGPLAALAMFQTTTITLTIKVSARSHGPGRSKQGPSQAMGGLTPPANSSSSKTPYTADLPLSS
jgi:hypothetical protein